MVGNPKGIVIKGKVDMNQKFKHHENSYELLQR
jgi:hypothetical protein